MTIGLILQYYAIICIVCSPLSLAALVVLYKKTDLIDKLDLWLDRMLGLKEKDIIKGIEKQGGAKKKDGQDGEEEIENGYIPGITHIKIPIGGIYSCQLNIMSKRNSTARFQWQSDNEFIGKVDEKGNFKGLKAGTAKIYYESEASGEEQPIWVYNIEVIPTDREWFADRYIKAVLEGEKKVNVLAGERDRRLISINDDKDVFTYRGGKNGRGVIFQFSPRGLERCVIQMKWNDLNKEYSGLAGKLEERFNKVQTNRENFYIWIHQNISAGDSEVNAYVYVKNIGTNNYALCIGRAWRECGTETEFLQNISMAETMFMDCLPGIKPVSTTAIQKDSDTAREESVRAESPVRQGEKESNLESSVNEDEGAEEHLNSETINIIDEVREEISGKYYELSKKMLDKKAAKSSKPKNDNNPETKEPVEEESNETPVDEQEPVLQADEPDNNDMQDYVEEYNGTEDFGEDSDL